MNMKTALIGSFAAAAALVAVTTDASARSWHYRTACGPSATIIKHHRYGYVGSDHDYGVRSRTYIHGERYGWRGGRDRIGVSVRERERGGMHANINARVRGGEDRHGARMSGNQHDTGAGTRNATGRSVSPSGTSNAGHSGAASSGSGKSGGGLGTSGGTSGSQGGSMSSGGGGGGAGNR